MSHPTDRADWYTGYIAGRRDSEADWHRGYAAGKRGAEAEIGPPRLGSEEGMTDVEHLEDMERFAVTLKERDAKIEELHAKVDNWAAINAATGLELGQQKAEIERLRFDLKELADYSDANDAKIELLTAALENYACRGLGRCHEQRLKDGSCILAMVGKCGDEAYRALEQSRGG